MENQHETISIHVGQCGVQLGDNLWELYCNEQSIDPNGKLIYEKYFFNDPFFSETKSGKYIPRALFVDLDAESIDNIRTGRRKNLYNSDQFISYNEDASKNYACGYYTTGPHLIERTLEGIRKLANQCSNLQGFMIFHSLGGGTGSGFSSLLFDRLNSEYPKASKFNFAIFPSEIGCSSNYEIYNTALSVHSIDDQMKCCFSFDNKSLYDISKRLLDVSNPSFRTMNEIVCQVAASVTNPLRQNRSNVENATLNIFRSYANLRPFYTPNFLVCSYAPLYPAPRSCAQFTVDDLTKDAFEPENVLIECNIRKRKYYACGFFYRGGICPKDITEAVQNILRRGIFQFVNSPDCFQFGLNYQYGSTIDNSEMIKYTSSLCLVSNTTAIADKWSKIDQEFNSLYKKRQYIHSYICEGMEQLEFKEAQDELNNLLNEYEDFDASDTEIEEEKEF